MRIISDFFDYYDSVQKYDEDRSVIYLRKTIVYKKGEYPEIVNALGKKIEVCYPVKEFYFRDSLNTLYRGKTATGSVDLCATQGEVIFCGKVYRFVSFREMPKPKATYCYTVDDCIEYLTNYMVDVNTKRGRFGVKRSYLQDLIKFFNYKPIDQEWCITNKIICVNYSKSAVVINPSLKDLEFYKVLDVNAAYQELSMWVGGTLAFPQNAMVELSDKDMITKHGFDKWSFRKMPEKVR